VIPLVQIILTLVGSLFSAKVLNIFGTNPPASASNVNGSVSVLSDHPAATAAAATAPASVAVSAVTQKAPALKQIVSDTVNQPYSVWGLAALGLVAVPLFGQFRAFFHEAGTAAGDVYNEGKRQNASLNDTTNRSRRK